ncbi:epoxide hydrolase [Arthrobacter sp. zg-Y826]|uniref:epoxide hydrolase family protein n=1 Tax=Arthrobacter jinronghuae TaxID=2964609 RepID=UPI0021071075|nr:epoxide hydrolase family protein [Arthrobacter jinronghuae]MCQ1955100.1 epoxide hydrolase [Arthrobacter jinronghuae]
MNDQIQPFSIPIDPAEVDRLKDRLRGTRFAPALPGEEWATGVPAGYLERVVTYWADEYDWVFHATTLNDLPQFTTVIDGQQIHFLHIRSKVEGALPLLLTHGWPGSFVEFLDLIGPLTDPAAYGRGTVDAFDLVIPSLPGFGFSTPVAQAGWDTARIGRAWATLMSRLGYDRYGAHGGDIGAAVSPDVARAAPGNVAGVHVNGSMGMPLQTPTSDDLAAFTPLELDRLSRVQRFMQEEYGYIAIQSTRPQTIAAGLVDSPAGQLAWILDKFQKWTFPEKALPEAVIDLDRILTNVMLYWVTGSAGTAAFIGYAQQPAWGARREPSGVPTGVIMFAHDVGIRRYAEQENTITRWTDITDRGGHFAALEEPALLMDDLADFFRPLR